MNGFQSSYVQDVSRNLQRLFQDGKFLDVTLCLSGTEFRSNRMLLASSSEYFRALLQFEPQSMSKSSFDLSSPYLTIDGFSYLIRFINSLGQDCPQINKEDYESVYVAASFLQVSSLQQMLSEMISQNLMPTNVLGALKLAYVFEDHILYRKSMFALLNEFYEIDPFSEDFLTLEPKHLEEILLSDHLNVPREGFVVKALLAWVCYDVSGRTNYFRRMFLRLLRLPLVRSNDLKNIVACPKFATAQEALNLLLWAHRSLTGPFTSPQSLQEVGPPDVSILPEFDQLCRPRTGTNFRIHAVGGVEELSLKSTECDYSCHSAEFLLYDTELRFASSLAAPTEPARVYHAVATTLSWIYVVGGESEEGELLNHCARYNLVEKSWFPMAVLDAPRSHHRIVCVETFVYAFGGYRLNWTTGYSPATDSILIYDAIANQWTIAPHRLPFAPIDMGVALVPSKRMIMLAGGLHEHGAEMRPSDRVLLYDPAEDSDACFNALPRLPLPLAGVALVYDDTSNHVFACGGQTDDAHSGRPNVIGGNLFGQILAFDFDTNAWTFVTMLDCPRYRASAVISRATLYVLGGVTVDEMVERTAHLFNDPSSESSSDSIGSYQQNRILSQLAQVNPSRPSLLQAPFHTCHVTEAWLLREPALIHTNQSNGCVDCLDTEEDDFMGIMPPLRLRRVHMQPARHQDLCPVLPRCLSNYVIAPYFY